jgi:hypothetical protein
LSCPSPCLPGLLFNAYYVAVFLSLQAIGAAYIGLVVWTFRRKSPAMTVILGELAEPGKDRKHAFNLQLLPAILRRNGASKDTVDLVVDEMANAQPRKGKHHADKLADAEMGLHA